MGYMHLPEDKTRRAIGRVARMTEAIMMTTMQCWLLKPF